MTGNRVNEPEISEAEIDQLLAQIEADAGAGGYRLNPDQEFTRDLVRSLLINQKRYGYPSCPCRLSGGERAKDLDIICPCDYRDPDLNDYNACYCALYVTEAIVKGKKQLKPVPERRPVKREVAPPQAPDPETGLAAIPGIPAKLSYPVWRCKVCGYLCARDNPPGICPICKAKRERFEKFL